MAFATKASSYYRWMPLGQETGVFGTRRPFQSARGTPDKGAASRKVSTVQTKRLTRRD
jgi:hypothetical protein